MWLLCQQDLGDFVRTTTLAAYENEVNIIFLDVAVDEKDNTVYKGNRVQLSRLRVAWLAAHKAYAPAG